MRPAAPRMRVPAGPGRARSPRRWRPRQGPRARGQREGVGERQRLTPRSPAAAPLPSAAGPALRPFLSPRPGSNSSFPAPVPPSSPRRSPLAPPCGLPPAARGGHPRSSRPPGPDPGAARSSPPVSAHRAPGSSDNKGGSGLPLPIRPPRRRAREVRGEPGRGGGTGAPQVPTGRCA